MQTSRRRLNVDVEELDRVIDAAEDGPLSKSDCQKLKTTLHALVERLAPKRNTEKTNSVLKPKNSSSTEADDSRLHAVSGALGEETVMEGNGRSLSYFVGKGFRCRRIRR